MVGSQSRTGAVVLLLLGLPASRPGCSAGAEPGLGRQDELQAVGRSLAELREGRRKDEEVGVEAWRGGEGDGRRRDGRAEGSAMKLVR